jgi:hypothetical protein
MSAPARLAPVAESLSRFSRDGKTSAPYYAYFRKDGKQIKQKLEAVELEQASANRTPFAAGRTASIPPHEK